MATRILVTGGAGFIGSFLVDALVSRGHAVTVFDNLEEQVHGTSLPPYLNRGARYVWGSVLDYDALRDVTVDAEVIFHLAAMVGVGQSQYQVSRYTAVNALGTANLLDILANSRHRCRKLIVASSMSTYGEGLYECRRHGRVRPPLRAEAQMAAGVWELACPACGDPLCPLPIPETERQECNSVYAIGKKTQEELVMVFGRTYGLATVALRYFNAYGPRQSLSNPYTGVAAIFLSRLRNDQPPVLYEDGLQTRDFVSVHDVTQANLLAMEKSAADGEVFNVGGGEHVSVRDLALRLAAICGKDITPTVTGRFRKGDVRHCVGDLTKIRERLGYRPTVNLTCGMSELVRSSQDAPTVDKYEDAARELSARGLG